MPALAWLAPSTSPPVLTAHTAPPASIPTAASSRGPRNSGRSARRAGADLHFGAIERAGQAAEAQQQQALLNYRQTISTAFRDVEDALVNTTKGRSSWLRRPARWQPEHLRPDWQAAV